MKIALVAALTLLLGLFLGGLGPRSELRKAREDLETARTAASRANSMSAAPMALGALFAARDRANDRAVAPIAASPAPRESPGPSSTPAGVAEAQPDGGGGGWMAASWVGAGAWS